MQIIVTHGHLARARVLSVSKRGLLLAAVLVGALIASVGAAAYHLLAEAASREGWPAAQRLVQLVVRDDAEQRDRFLRENLDAMAAKIGELQAKLLELEAVGERVSGMAGLKPQDLQGLDRGGPGPAAGGPATGRASAPAGAASGGSGGPYRPVDAASLEQLDAALAALDEMAAYRSDVFTLIESRLTEARLHTLMLPSSAPVEAPLSSGFGFRSDPFTGRRALHTGLDFSAETGAPIVAAAGGVVRSAETHPAYGRMVELDHGNGLVTRYAHASRLRVQPGDLVRRGQTIAEVGSTGRSTGPHLHFEVLVGGVPQNPAKFLALGKKPGAALAAAVEETGRR